MVEISALASHSGKVCATSLLFGQRTIKCGGTGVIARTFTFTPGHILPKYISTAGPLRKCDMPMELRGFIRKTGSIRLQGQGGRLRSKQS
jgi:hypothetical protein